MRFLFCWYFHVALYQRIELVWHTLFMIRGFNVQVCHGVILEHLASGRLRMKDENDKIDKTLKCPGMMKFIKDINTPLSIEFCLLAQEDDD